MPSIKKSSGSAASDASVGIGANSKGSADDLRNPLRFIVHLLIGEADDLEASRSQIEITSAVVHERDVTTVVVVTVGFDDQAPVVPKKVDEVWANTDVDLWAR